MIISVFKPSIKRKDMDAVLTCLVSEKISCGEKGKEFIQNGAEYIGAAGGIVLREYKRAIRTVIEALSLEAGAKVIISPLCSGVYLDVILEKGLEPLYADVEIDSGCIDPSNIEKLMKYNPDAVVVDYPLGFVPNMEAIAELGIPIIEDITNGLGGNTGVKKAGRYGKYIIIGLEENSIITAGGGVLLLADSKSDLTELRKAVSHIPQNAKLPDMNSVLGLSQLSSLESYISIRREIAQVYIRSLMKTRHKTLIQKGEGENVFYSFPVLLESGMKEISQYARKKGIRTEIAFSNTSLETCNLSQFPCPNAETLMMRCILFPVYPMLGKKNISLISKVLATLP